MKVLVIPEDHTLDQHILKPVVEHIFRDVGRKAKVFVLQNPRLRGVAQALDKDMLARVLDESPMIDLFLLIVDRDCDKTRKDRLEARIQQATKSGKAMLGCLAVEEVEVWALALHRGEFDNWPDVRRECHPKEVYFDPFVAKKNWLETVGKGRTAAMKALAGNWKSLKSVCCEIQELQGEITAWLANR